MIEGKHAANLSCSCADGELLVREGDWVVLESSDGKRVLGHVSPLATARLGKRKRSIGGLIGCKYGDVYSLRDGNRLELVDDFGRFDHLPGEDAMRTDKDNRNLQDTEDNQTLSHQAIEGLKAAGLGGQSLVQVVAEHSSTFQNKTPFSQDKYLKRKLRKYDLRVRVVRPTGFSICETYFAKSPEKTLCLRPDALALLLGYSGVRAGCKAIVYETCTGVVTASMAERMGGHGTLLNVFTGSSPSGVSTLRMLKLPQTTFLNHSVVHTPLEIFDKLNEVEGRDSDWIRYGDKECISSHLDCSGVDKNREDSNDDDCKQFEASARRLDVLSMRPKRSEVKKLIRGKCDVLVVATRDDLCPVLDKLLRHVAPSGSFAVYSMYLQALSELQWALQMSKMAARVELMESSLVFHQVLPGRSHPMMTDSATGGYVLWGIRIDVAPPLSAGPSCGNK